MQRRRNTKGKRHIRTRSNLRSIPILFMLKNKYKSNVLYSIPSVVVLVFLFGLFLFQEESYAAIYCTSDCPAPDATTISPVPTPTPATPTASLSLNSSSLTSNAVTPGNIATASTNVTVSVSNASSYSLTLKMDNINLTNGSTTITAGNPDSTSSNVWGYKWDNASSYTAPSASGNTLIPTTSVSGNISFTKTLTFGAKFSSSANAGAYHTNGTISLVATPKETVITLADLTQMQQLAEGYAPEACTNTPYLSGKNYSETYTLTDVRDNNTYTVAKLGDGKCWMTSNLRLAERNVADGVWYDQRILTSTTSDVSTSWTLPASSTSGFSSDAASNVYLANSTGYYTWCAATAGTCSGLSSSGQHANYSICPKGWRLPGGYNDATYGNEFYTLFNAINTKTTIVSGTLSSGNGGSSSWANNGLSTVQGSPYNFAFTGRVANGSYDAPASYQYGYWWSSTANSSARAYRLYISSSGVYPGTNDSVRRYGFAVRCVAK